ncbi:hypothetical protein KEM52_003201 [Ascosphaera acerosa]|nr:hypothetical protein KEM52_003201 [Ascosphaera acerosa]
MAQPNSAGGDLPPGTAYLFDEHGNVRKNHLVLEPTPTSDPNDPLNWSAIRKHTNVGLTMVATTIIFTAMDVNQEQLINGSAVGLAGTAVGCNLLVPFAIKYGRRSNYIIGIFFMTLLSVWQALMTDWKQMYATQFLLGLTQAPNETIVQMTISDLFFVHQRGAADAWYMNMVNVGVRHLHGLCSPKCIKADKKAQSFMSPIIAGYISEARGWRFTYWLLTAFYGAILLAFIFIFEETKYVPSLAAQVGQLDPTASLHDGPAKQKESEDTEDRKVAPPLSQVQIDAIELGEVAIDSSIPKNTYWQRMRFWTITDEPMWPLIWRPFYLLCMFPNILYCGLTYAFSLCWISVMANVQAMYMPMPPYNMGPGAIGLQSLGPFIGAVIGSFYSGWVSDWLIVRLARRNNGYYEPEMRLHVSHLGMLCQPAGILMFGLCLARNMHWMYLQVGGGIFGFGLGCLSSNAITVVIDSYRGVTGEAFVGIAFLRNCFSIALVFAINPWLARQGLQNMFIVIGVWSFVVCGLHLPLLKWGKALRRHTAPRYWQFLESKGEVRA